ncbi:MAG: diguanylate cyclase [Pseudomonadota bacterium]
MFNSSRRTFLILALVPMLAIAVLSAMVAADSRRDVAEHALRANANLANTVEENIRRTLDFYDRSLQGILEEVSDPATMALPPEVRQRVVFDKAVAVPGVSSLAVTDAQGRIILASDPSFTRGMSVAQRSYFRRHRDQSGLGLDISEPFIALLDRQPIVVLSRRVDRRDGSFGGIVAVAIHVRYFHDLFNAVNLGKDGRITLLLSNGTVLSRFPLDESVIGQARDGSPIFGRHLRGDNHFVARSDVDGRSRFYLFKDFEKYPLVISVAQATDVVYADWRKRTWLLGVITLSLMAASTVLAWLLLRELDMRHRTAQQLRTAEHDLRTILDGLPSMVAYWDKRLLIRFANSRYLETFPTAADEVGDHLPGLQKGQRLVGANAPYFERALRGERQEFETPVVDARGRTRHLLVSFVPDMNGGVMDGVFVQATDISERKAAEDRLFEEKERIRVTLASIGDAVISTDREGRVSYLNPAAEALSGWTLGEAVGRPVAEVVPLREGEGDDGTRERHPVEQALRQQEVIGPSPSAGLVNRWQSRFDIEDTAAPIHDRDGRVLGAVMVLRDVTQARAMVQRMAHLAQYDALTGLPNRVLLMDRAAQAVARANREGTGFAVMYLDLDGFKDINDSLGHDVGDAVLVQFAQRMSTALRQSDTLCRQGGDEFVVLAPMVPDAESAHALAAKLVRLAAQPFTVAGCELQVTTSLGIALFPEDGNRYDTLARHADAAMYTAKRAGKNQLRFYTGEIGALADRQFELNHRPPAA